MDSFTQAFLGATLVEAAGLRKPLGRRIVVFGAVLAALPDADMIVSMDGPWASLLYHRGPTHNLFFLALLSPFFGWLGWRFMGRRGRWGQWAFGALLALVSAPLLDWRTPYGTQLFNPITWQRSALDAISILDPIYTVPLVVAMGVGLCRHKAADYTRPVAIAALVFTTLYLGMGYVNSQRMIALGREVLAREGREVVHIRALPVIFSANQYWRIVARHPDGDISVAYASALRSDSLQFELMPTDKGPYIEKALDSREGRIFRWFADGFVSARVVASEDGDGSVAVLLLDRRYGMPSQPKNPFFQALVKFDSQGLVAEVKRVRGRRDIKIEEELSLIWTAIFNGYDPEEADHPLP